MERLISRTSQGAGLRWKTVPSLSSSASMKPRGRSVVRAEESRGGIGIDDHDDVAEREHVGPPAMKRHLLLEARVGGRVGEDDDGRAIHSEIGEVDLGRVEDAGAVGLPAWRPASGRSRPARKPGPAAAARRAARMRAV
jgi:hypothetical protein